MKLKVYTTIFFLNIFLGLGAQSVVDNTPVHLPLNETEGAVELINSGTVTSVTPTIVTSGAVFTPGVNDTDLGQVLYVNSNYNGHVRLDDTDGPFVGSIGGSPRTYAFWMKQTVLNFQDLLGSGTEIPFFKIQVQSNGALRLVDEAGNRVASQTLMTGDTWHHVAVTVSENSNIQDASIYIDGILTDKNFVGSNDPINTSASEIKLFISAKDCYFSDFRYYDYELSESEIGELYALKKNDANGGIQVFDLNGFINDELDAGNSTVVVPPGKYKVPPLNGTTHLRFEGRNNVTIIADGVEMICSETLQAIQIDNCNNFKIQGLKVDYDPLPFTQGEIVDISEDGTLLTFDIIDGYEVDGVSNFLYGNKMEVFDAQTGELSGATYYGISTDLDVASQRVVVTKESRNSWTTGVEQVGDIAVLGVRGPRRVPHTILAENCTGLTLENVTIYSGTSFAFFERYCSESQYINCSVDRRPLEDDYKSRGMRRMRSNTADAFHSKHAEVGPAYIGCIARYMGDDAYAINGDFHIVTGSSGNVLTVVAKGGGNNSLNLMSGETVELVTYSGVRLPNAVIQNIEPGRALTSEEVTFLTNQTFSGSADDTYTAEKVYNVTIDREIDLPLGSLINSSNRIGNGFEVRDCIAGPNRSRGILVKAGNGIITGNTCIDNWGDAIKISPEYRWLEAGSGSNIIISNNTISGARDLAIGVYAFGGNNSASPPGAHDNIQIFGNSITNSSNPAIAITSTSNLYIENNDISSVNNDLLLDRSLNRWGRNEDLSRQIYYENVEFSENIAFEKPVTVSNANLPAINLVDNDVLTRWSAESFPQSAEIDLGAVYDINRIDLYPFEARDYQYTIELKDDESSSYSLVLDQSDNTSGGYLLTDGVSASGRYLKVTVTGAHTYSGSAVELSELKVYGTAAFVLGRETDTDNDYRIFPNPFSDTLNIIHRSGNVNFTVYMFEVTGRLHSVHELKQGEKTINLQGLDSGVYYLKIHDDKGTRVKKIIKK